MIKIPTRQRFGNGNNKHKVVLQDRKQLSDENRVTYNSDKTFSVKSGMLDSNAPMNVNPDYEATPYVLKSN